MERIPHIRSIVGTGRSIFWRWWTADPIQTMLSTLTPPRFPNSYDTTASLQYRIYDTRTYVKLRKPDQTSTGILGQTSRYKKTKNPQNPFLLTHSKPSESTAKEPNQNVSPHRPLLIVNRVHHPSPLSLRTSLKRTLMNFYVWFKKQKCVAWVNSHSPRLNNPSCSCVTTISCPKVLNVSNLT